MIGTEATPAPEIGAARDAESIQKALKQLEEDFDDSTVHKEDMPDIPADIAPPSAGGVRLEHPPVGTSAPFIGSLGFEAADAEGNPVPVSTEVDDAVFRGGDPEGPQ
eukprot:4443365-Lingulodinium_polyedra.AAC.1